MSIFVALCLLLNLSLARPTETATYDEDDVDPSEYYGNLSRDVIKQIQKCDRNLETMELCMRCAKVTKSEIVYPMCCDNEDSVKDWCFEYIYYGSQK